MSLMHTVTALVEKGIADNAVALMPHCHGHTRQQIMIALCNAAQRGWIHRVGRTTSLGKPGQRLGTYAAGPRPDEPYKAKEGTRPLNSVFQMGERMGLVETHRRYTA